MTIHRENIVTLGSSRLNGRLLRRYVLGIVGAAVGLVAIEPSTAQADGLCATMHDWKTRPAGVSAAWQNKHSSQKDVMYDPETAEWVHVAKKGRRDNAHSTMDDGHVTNEAHPACGGGGEV